MRFDWPCRLIFLLAPAFASGCLQTSYHKLHQDGPPKGESESLFDRRVDYRLTNAFYETAPTCAAITTKSPAPPEIARLVEEAVERHLVTRLPRVIGAAQLRRAESRLGIDMDVAGDRRVFSRQARCTALVKIHLAQVRDDYLVLWAQRGLTVSIAMTRIKDGALLWQARHVAGRADGGLPISVLNLPVSAARAALVSTDPEMFASIADDAARRMMRTLPNIRSIDRNFSPLSAGR